MYCNDYVSSNNYQQPNDFLQDKSGHEYILKNSMSDEYIIIISCILCYLIYNFWYHFEL